MESSTYGLDKKKTFDIDFSINYKRQNLEKDFTGSERLVKNWHLILYLFTFVIITSGKDSIEAVLLSIFAVLWFDGFISR
jgi:dolichol kinase